MTGIFPRIAVVFMAFAILVWRTPSTFTRPQFWAEDGILFTAAITDGWASLCGTIAGYLMVAQALVAVLAAHFSPAIAPAIYCYSAVALTLLVVLLVTSPRLDLPAKPLLGIAVVIVPMGYEELGVLCNVQWILPIGAFAMLFMRRAESPAVLFAEALFIAVVAVTGPFSIFLAPLFGWRAWAAHGQDRRRLQLLFLIIAAGGLIQCALMFHRHVPAIAAQAYDWKLWINIPLRQIATGFGPAYYWFNGMQGVLIGIPMLLGVAALSMIPPYRSQKMCMFYFGIVIAVSGMLKFREALETQRDATRYFYIASVLFLWFICCTTIRARGLAYAAVAIAEFAMLPVIHNRQLITTDQQWAAWSARLEGGEDVTIPISPTGWFVKLPEGALAKIQRP